MPLRGCSYKSVEVTGVYSVHASWLSLAPYFLPFFDRRSTAKHILRGCSSIRYFTVTQRIFAWKLAVWRWYKGATIHSNIRAFHIQFRELNFFFLDFSTFRFEFELKYWVKYAILGMNFFLWILECNALRNKGYRFGKNRTCNNFVFNYFYEKILKASLQWIPNSKSNICVCFVIIIIQRINKYFYIKRNISSNFIILQRTF